MRIWISLRFLLSEVLFSSLIGVYPYLAWKQVLFFLLSLIYDAFSNLSIVFTSLISDDFSFKSGSRTRCIPYICGYFYLLYMMYIRFISSFISDNHLKIRWSTVPSCHVYCFDYCCWHCYWYLARQQIRKYGICDAYILCGSSMDNKAVVGDAIGYAMIVAMKW